MQVRHRCINSQETCCPRPSCTPHSENGVSADSVLSDLSEHSQVCGRADGIARSSIVKSCVESGLRSADPAATSQAMATCPSMSAQIFASGAASMAPSV